MNKITQFLKKNVFYIAMSVVIVGALVAVLFLPKEGNVPPDSNIKNEQADGTVTDDYDNEVAVVDDEVPSESPTNEDNTAQEDAAVSSEETKNNEVSSQTTQTSETPTPTATTDSKVEEEVSTETFESTTVDNLEEPFFAEGDTFNLPVEGKVIVPYRDDSTKYWFSESLNQTMRTYGICFAAKEGEAVKAVAQGTVLDIIPDSTTLDDSSLANVGDLGKVMIVDLGNGYKVAYGFQNGTPDESLKGKVVNAGDVLGTVGAPTGAFIEEGNNIYLQVTYNDKVVNPENFLPED